MTLELRSGRSCVLRQPLRTSFQLLTVAFTKGPREELLLTTAAGIGVSDGASRGVMNECDRGEGPLRLFEVSNLARVRQPGNEARAFEPHA
jgi:hypothetical protein